MIVVGLSGYAGAGKDSVADILVRDYGFTKMAFADPIKRMVRRLDPIIGHELYAGCCEDCSDQPEVTEVRMSDALKFGFDDQSLKHSPWAKEVRDLWQRFGTDVVREEDEDYWVKVAERELQKTTAERIVFTDVRFENEADFIYDLQDGLYDGRAELMLAATSSVWRVARPDNYPANVHASEQMIGLLGEQVTILNDGPLEDLKEPVALAVDLLLKKDDPGQRPFEMDGWE